MTLRSIRRRVPATLLALFASVTTALAALDNGPFHWVTLGLVAAALAIGAATGPFAGIIVGIVAASAFVATHIVTGEWYRGDRLTMIIITAALLAAGWVAGLHGRHLRTKRVTAADSAIAKPLLTRREAMTYLDSEFDRARAYQRPLSVVTARVVPHVDADDPVYPRVKRAAERILLACLPPVAVPFTGTEAELGFIAPEHNAAQAEALASQVGTALVTGKYTDPVDGHERPMESMVTVELGVGSLSESTIDANRLFSDAENTLRPLHELPPSAGAQATWVI